MVIMPWEFFYNNINIIIMYKKLTENADKIAKSDKSTSGQTENFNIY